MSVYLNIYFAHISILLLLLLFIKLNELLLVWRFDFDIYWYVILFNFGYCSMDGFVNVCCCFKIEVHTNDREQECKTKIYSTSR